MFAHCKQCPPLLAKRQHALHNPRSLAGVLAERLIIVVVTVRGGTTSVAVFVRVVNVAIAVNVRVVAVIIAAAITDGVA